MDVWEKFPQVSRHPNRRDQGQTCPSFSSTLLDAIYRSIDEPDSSEGIFRRETTMRKKNHVNPFQKQEDAARFHLARKVFAGETVSVRRKSTADSDRTRGTGHESAFRNSNSSSASSDYSGFSSSESDSFYRPKPIRTSAAEKISREEAEKIYHSATQKPSKHEGRFVRTKSKALKIYSDLKKAKQPISPGGRLASFLNSLFTAGNAKKAKMIYQERKTKTEQTPSSTCSSASSFSRSCLSKTPSSRGKANDTTKRSVTFYPVSEIVDEDCKPCGHKRLHENQTNQIDKGLEFRIMEENRRVVEAAKELLKSYHKKKEEFDNGDKEISSNDDDDEDDDAASYASSDLFELDNLSAIGIERYREELPVYETTHLGTNRAIASGLIV